jgi:SAM-dependent methyltransferase
MPDFSDFDARGYRTVDVRSGYAEWVPTYEQTVEDAMDIALLETLASVPWTSLGSAADLGCGTGRTGAWLKRRGVEVIDGVDITPEMLAVARETGVYRRLVEADVASTGLDAGTYYLVIACLVDEHLPDLRPLYREAQRLAKNQGFFVLAGFHPHFIMAFGVPTHLDSASGEPVAIETHIHLLSEHITTALVAGWTLIEMKERVIDEAWLELKPQWELYRGHPVSFALVWRKAVTGAAAASPRPFRRRWTRG